MLAWMGYSVLGCLINLSSAKCSAGNFMDGSDGCSPCPVDTYSNGKTELHACLLSYYDN